MSISSDLPGPSRITSTKVNCPPKRKLATGDHPDWNEKKGGNLTMRDFEIGKKLDAGTFGKVYLTRHKKSGFIVAVKTISKDYVKKVRLERTIVREIEIHAHLRHPNIIRFHNYFWDATRVYLVLEYAPYGSVFELLQARRRFDEPTSAAYVLQVADALNYCHSKGVVHRDLKPENILIGADRQLKLADFGWSCRIGSDGGGGGRGGADETDKRRRTVCGTVQYFAPEMVNEHEHDKSVDVWCLGVLMYEFLVGHSPFEDKDDVRTKIKIQNMMYKFPGHVSTGARDLISRLLKKDAEARLPLEQVMVHPWITIQVYVYKESRKRKLEAAAAKTTAVAAKKRKTRVV